MTTDEAAALRSMTTARLRRNYWLCASQLELCWQDAPRLDKTAATLQAWQSAYLDELVERGART